MELTKYLIKNWQIKHNISALSLLINHKEAKYQYLNGYISKNVKKEIDINNIFEVGSITKLFIAILILKCLESKQLSLDNSLDLYFPQYPKWAKVTISELLNMTSIVPNFFEHEKFKRALLNNYPVYNPDMLINLAYDMPEIKREGNWYYSNTNYLLLGKIIEIIYHESLEIILKDFFAKYNLSNTYFSQTSYEQQIINHKVHGYYNDIDITSILPSNFGATASMLMNANDLSELVSLLLVKKVILSEDLLNILFSTIKVPDSLGRPKNTKYGLGVFVSEDINFGTIIWYVGLTIGYSSVFLYLPNQKLTIVGQINQLYGESLKIKNHDLLFPHGELMQNLLMDIWTLPRK